MAECASPDILDDEDVLVSSTMDTYSMCVQCGVVAKEGLMRKEEKERKLKELEERKIKANETRKIQMEEVKKSEEIEKENLKKIEERMSNKSQDQEKIDQN